MNADAILKYEKDPAEDYYAILGCDPSSTTEQILTEFKLRAKEVHPDKCSDAEMIQSQEKFKQLLEAKNTLTDPDQRKRYDAWRNSGLAISYKNWIGLKDSVQHSMHWVTPKTAGRMLQSGNLLVEEEAVSLKTSPVTEKDVEASYVVAANEGQEDEEIEYEPTPYDELGYRMSTPPPDLDIDSLPGSSGGGGGNVDKVPLKPQLSKTKSVSKEGGSGDDAKIAMRRKLFAVRRESTIGTMVMADKLDDAEIRRKFRNYEI